MKRVRQSGFSLVELMIAVLLASITAVVVLSVLSSYRSRSTSVTGRNDAQVNAAAGLYMLEKEVRMAGSGLTTAEGPMCQDRGVNIAYDGVRFFNGDTLMPLRIIDGGAGPDQIEIVRNDSGFGATPTRLVQAMAAPTSQLAVDGRADVNSGDLVMLGSASGNKTCTLMEITREPDVNGSGWLLTHAAGVGNYNAADPGSLFTDPVSYDVRDYVINMGRYGVRRYGIVCSDKAAPSADNSCDLAEWNPLAFGDPDLADVSSISPQMVELQAQYGVAPAGSEVVNEWVDATGAWANPDWDDTRRIRAVRLSLVARSVREGLVGPTSVVLWDAGEATEATHAFTADEQHFRYQVLTVVVPLVNVIWAGI
jgi:type IV pilus assembly protein PilW